MTILINETREIEIDKAYFDIAQKRISEVNN